MAQATPISRVLQLRLQTGTSASGQPKLSNHNFANVDMAASDDDILAVGQALSALMSDPVVQIARVDQVELNANSTSTGA